MATNPDALAHLRDALATVQALYVDCCNNVATRLKDYHRQLMNQHLRECLAMDTQPELELLEALIEAGADDVKSAIKSLVERPNPNIRVACRWAEKYQHLGLNRVQVLEVPFAKNPTLVLNILSDMGDFDMFRALVNNDFTQPAVTNELLQTMLWNMAKWNKFNVLGPVIEARRARGLPSSNVALQCVLRDAALCNDEMAVELALNAGTDTPLDLSAALAMYCRLRHEGKILALLAQGAFPTGSMLDDLVVHHEFLGPTREAHENMLVRVIPYLVMHGVALPKSGSRTECIVRELAARLNATDYADPAKTKFWVHTCLCEEPQPAVADGDATLELGSNCHFRPNVVIDNRSVTR